MIYFRPHLLKIHVIIFVPHPIVMSLFVKQDLGERKENSLTRLQEYDLEFKPNHITKGHNLYQLATKAINFLEEDSFGWKQ